MALPEWAQYLGGGSLVALLIIKEVRHWTVSLLNKRNNSKEEKRIPCAYTPEVKNAIMNNVLTAKACEEIKGNLQDLSKETTIQTNEIKNQTRVLEKIEKNLNGK